MQIIRDSREQHGFDFAMTGATVKVQGLKCGDYTTSTLLNKVAVERKANTGEIYLNLCNKVGKARFFREVEKLKLLDHAIVVFEFPESHMHIFPEKSNMPKFRKEDYLLGNTDIPWGYVKATAKYLRRCVHEIEDQGIPVKYCGSRNEAEDFVFKYLQNLEAQYAGNVSP